LVIDGFAVSMAAVAWAASLDARPAVPARLATLIAVGASSASNGEWAYLRAHHDVVTVVLGVAVPIAANLAFEVLLAELRRQVQRRRGLPPPVAVPYPRLIRLVLSPWRTFRGWRQLVLELTALTPAPVAGPPIAGPPVHAHDQQGESPARAPLRPDPCPVDHVAGSERSAPAGERAQPPPTQPERPARTPPERPAATQPERPAAIQPERPAAIQPERPAAIQPERPAATEPERPARTPPERPTTTPPEPPTTAGRRATSAPSRPHVAAPSGPNRPTRPTPRGRPVPTAASAALRPADPRVELLARHLATAADPRQITGESVGTLLNQETSPRTGRRLLKEARELVERRQQAEAGVPDTQLRLIGGR
jgi:hypothetical protein